MYNGGAKNVTYKLDLAPLDMLKAENFEHEIFKVINPVGQIKPGQTALLEWNFNPLEAKTYMVRMSLPNDVTQQWTSLNDVTVSFRNVSFIGQKIMTDVWPSITYL